jgi:hypothetical protein
MKILLIHGRDHDDNTSFIIGAADSVEKAEKMIEEYFGEGEYRVISKDDAREGGLESISVIECSEFLGSKSVHTVILEWGILNKL